MIPDDVISEIRERIDIVALVGEYVTLKRRGANFVGLCPFHSEKTPSFNVHRERRFFHCFGCQASGDAISFLMRIEGSTFPEAARTLAERSGIEIAPFDEVDDAAVRRERARKERLFGLVEAAAGFYRRQLESAEETSVARQEIERRAISEETSAVFRLGYAPASWDALVRFLGRKSLSPAEAEQVGLLIPRRSGSGYYDRFRNRLMFPVCDLHGRVVAFSGRALAPPADEPLREEPKYVNSPESQLFNKGAMLFGLHQARVEIRRQGFAVLCEGNFDAIALYQAGLRNAVAPLGTAFTAEQAEILRRLTQRVTLLFDGDAAGRKAVRAAFPLLARAALAARVAVLPPGEDPDSFLRSRGVEALSALLERSRGIVEYLIDELAAESAGTASERARAIKEIGPLIAAVDSPVERQIYIEHVAKRFEIKDLEAVRQELRAGARADRSFWQGRAAGTDRERGERHSRPDQPARQPPELQGALLGILMDIPELFTDPAAKKLAELLTSTDLRSIFEAAASMVRDSGEIRASELLSLLENNPFIRWLEGRLAVQTYDSDTVARDELKNGVMRLAKQSIESELKSLERQIKDARRAGEDDRATSMMERYSELFRRSGSLINEVKG